MEGLTSSQKKAMDYIRMYAESRKEKAQSSVKEVLELSNIAWDQYEAAIVNMQAVARVALHFHPDRPLLGDKRVIESFLEDGIYKSQFETKISNGSLSAYIGGARDVWEMQLFDGAYHEQMSDISERPKYGALDLMEHSNGPTPSFGSCYFLLNQDVSQRCTYTYGGSQDNPSERGIYGQMDDIVAAILKDTFFREYALGEHQMSPRRMLEQLTTSLGQSMTERLQQPAHRNLNHYVEAQIHGSISLLDDVAILVADPSFIGTEMERKLELLCTKYDIRLYWHHGYSIDEANVPTDFRGAVMPSLAKEIAINHRIDAHTIGLAVNDLHQHKEKWSSRGTYAELLQQLKFMWHVVVKYGEPVR